VAITLALSGSIKSLQAISADTAAFLVLTHPIITRQSMTLDHAYAAELTDNSRQVYVTVSIYD
jgi:hypothetical protein